MLNFVRSLRDINESRCTDLLRLQTIFYYVDRPPCVADRSRLPVCKVKRLRCGIIKIVVKSKSEMRPSCSNLTSQFSLLFFSLFPTNIFFSFCFSPLRQLQISRCSKRHRYYCFRLVVSAAAAAAMWTAAAEEQKIKNKRLKAWELESRAAFGKILSILFS